jgi:hypothetical protein
MESNEQPVRMGAGWMACGERWRRGGIAGAMVLAVLLLGVLLRVPAPPRDVLRVAVAAAEPEVLPASPRAVLRRVDLTLAGQPAPVPIPSPDAWTVASDDGELVAVSGQAGFTVYDAATLEVRTVLERRLPGRVTVPPRFTPTSDALVLHRGRAVFYRPLDPSPPTVTTLLDPGLLIAEVVPLGAARAAVFAVGETPRLLVVDLLAGAIVIDVPLPGLRAEGPPADLPIEPGLGWDVERQRVYVAQAGGVTVVDLGTGAIVSRRPAPHPVADDTIERAAVSPDGTRLYVTGTRTGAFPTTLGLEVVDTSDLSTVAAFGLPVGTVEVSPDGRWLALGGGASGVFVMAAGEQSVRVTLGDPDSLTMGFDAASALLYVGGRRLQALDLDTARVVGTRQLDDGGRFLPSAALLVEPS